MNFIAGESERKPIELIRADLETAVEMLDILERAAAAGNVSEVRIIFRVTDGDWITVGYGESGNPAVIAVDPA